MTPKTTQKKEKTPQEKKAIKWKRGMDRMCMLENKRRIKELKDDLKDLIREYREERRKLGMKG